MSHNLTSHPKKKKTEVTPDKIDTVTITQSEPTFGGRRGQETGAPSSFIVDKQGKPIGTAITQGMSKAPQRNEPGKLMSLPTDIPSPLALEQKESAVFNFEKARQDIENVREFFNQKGSSLNEQARDIALGLTGAGAAVGIGKKLLGREAVEEAGKISEKT